MPILPFSRTDRSTAIRVLLVEDSASDARLVKEEVGAACGRIRLEVEHVSRLSEAVGRFGRQGYDAILLDLGLPDASGLEALSSLSDAAPDLPIVVLSGHEDEAVAVQAVRKGAQDYLVKGQGDGNLIIRSVLYAIERKRWEKQISMMAHQDGLTDLPNRRLLQDRLRQAVARSRRTGKGLALIFMDLDNFKTINDTMGHAAGDRLLQGVASRLRQAIRESDTVARLGGDEFAIVVSEIARREDAVALARKMQEILTAPFQIEDQEVRACASMGVSLYPDDGQDVDALLRSADAAMFRAKRRGGSQYEMTDREAAGGEDAPRSAAMLSLEEAIRKDELVVHYQPQVDLASGQVVSLEALVRWRAPGKGLLMPSEFLAQAEKEGLITAVDEWVLGATGSQLRRWRDSGLPLPRIAVNMSTRHFAREDLHEKLGAVIERAGLAPDGLELELSESALCRDPGLSIAPLQSLKSLGVRLVVDNFGAAGSLGHLTALPLDALKLDRGVVSAVVCGQREAAIGSALIGMSHALGLEIIGEGVEQAQQRDFLESEGCDRAQGYFLGRPADSDATTAVLRGSTKEKRSDDR